ncbi:MAG: ThiF family adenylyltransferase [Actinobacteria bacterium]|nr:ThiF family adenylyltransferase [Actinomycetota bacterium]
MSGLRASFLAAREALVNGLVRQGFRLVDDRTLLGDLEVHGQTVEHEIVLPDDFPIEKPVVRTPGGEGGLSWHRERDGAFCLWSDEEASHLPWASAEAVVERIEEWHRQDALGWPDDPPDLDLERYWPRSGALVIHGSLDELVGRECMVSRGQNGTYQLSRGRASRKQKRIRTWGAVVVDVGELERPLHTLDNLLDRLEDDTAHRLRSDIESGACKIVMVQYSRQGHSASLGLHVRSRQPLELEAATTAHADEATLRLRAGFDAEVLAEKRIVILGVGAVGSFLADLLARSGCTKFTLADPDKVRPGNCVRHLATLADVGRPKVDAVADRLTALGVDTGDIERHLERVTSAELIERLFEESDLVIDATGNGPATALVMTASRVLQRPALSVCLQRGGTVARLDRSPLNEGEEYAAATPPGGPAAQAREGGCGEPISPTPPWACAAAAALAAAMATDVLSGRCQYPPSLLQVLVGADVLPDVGTLR